MAAGRRPGIESAAAERLPVAETDLLYRSWICFISAGISKQRHGADGHHLDDLRSPIVFLPSCFFPSCFFLSCRWRRLPYRLLVLCIAVQLLDILCSWTEL